RWDLVLRAVEHHTRERWILLYVQRWLQAPLRRQDGTLAERTMGTPQGGLCAAAHNPPYEQRWVMRSVERLPRVGAVVTTERCA
ncbi:MAG TPA: hypothetical protein VNP92_13470, partial [Actinophytocola sp.]|nr:hypothetical protein [Actinophytocola sp.]